MGNHEQGDHDHCNCSNVDRGGGWFLTGNRFSLGRLQPSLLPQIWVGKSYSVMKMWLARFLIKETCDDGINTKLINRSGTKRYNEGIVVVRESLSQHNDKINICDLKVSSLKTVCNVSNRGNPCFHQFFFIHDHVEEFSAHGRSVLKPWAWWIWARLSQTSLAVLRWECGSRDLSRWRIIFTFEHFSFQI